MARGKFDQGYSFRSTDFRSQPDRWQQQAARARRPAASAEPAPGEDEDGRRPCTRGEWCSSYTLESRDDGTSRRVPARGYQAFCPKDRRIIESDLRDMPAQFAHLAAEIGRPSAGARVIRIPFGPRVPLRVDIDALLRAIVECLASWHERIADVDHLSYPPAVMSRRQRDLIAVSRAVGVLAVRVDALLALEPAPVTRAVALRDLAGLPDETDGIVHSAFAELHDPLGGSHAGTEILNLRWLCRAVLGETKAKPEELLGVPCRQEECDRLALRRAELPSQPDAPVWWSECASCGDRMTEAEYREWTALCAAYERNRARVPVLENLPGVA